MVLGVFWFVAFDICCLVVIHYAPVDDLGRGLLCGGFGFLVVFLVFGFGFGFRKVEHRPIVLCPPDFCVTPLTFSLP